MNAAVQVKPADRPDLAQTMPAFAKARCCRHAEKAEMDAKSAQALRELDALIEQEDAALRAAPAPVFDDATLARHVREFLPSSSGADLEHRVSLMIAREYATWLACRGLNKEAVEHARQAQRIAGLFLYADASAVTLKLATTYCRHLVQCAFLADHLDSEGIAL